MGKLFGTDGIRGHADEFPLDQETVRRIGAAFAHYFAEKLGRPPRFVSGRDTRESGRRIETNFHAGAKQERAAGESAGVITTPGVAYLTREFDFDAGVVISASHNPYFDNGIKIFLPNGRKLDQESEQVIEDLIESQSIIDRSSPEFPGPVNQTRFLESYVEHLAKNFAGLDLSGIKIVVDCANGAASGLAPELFRRFDADPVVINASPDGRNINRDCGSLHLEYLQSRVVEEEADFGVAFDGDADRALFVNEKGDIVDGDATLWILANYLNANGQLLSGKVVATLMSNIGLEISLRKLGIELLRTQVGDKYVLDALLETGSEIGGEQSGHIIIPGNSLVGDGLMTAFSVLRVLSKANCSFSELTDGFEAFPQILVNVRVKEKMPFDQVPEIANAAEILEKKLSNHGRLLLRYSGTENLARIMIEGKDQKSIEHAASELANVIGRVLG